MRAASKTEVGERLRALQSKSGIKARQISAALRVSEPTVSVWLQGKGLPSSHRWAEIASLLGTTVPELFLSPEPDEERACGRNPEAA